MSKAFLSYSPLFATIRHFSPLFATIRHYSPLFATIYHYSPLFASIRLYSPLFATVRCYSLFAIRDSSLFAIRYSRLFAILTLFGFSRHPIACVKIVTECKEYLKHVKAWLVPLLDPPRSLNPFPFRNIIGFCSRKTKIKQQYKIDEHIFMAVTCLMTS